MNMGYWPSVRPWWLDIGQVLFCPFMDRDEVEPSINSQKKNEANIRPTWSIKDLLYGFRGNFSCKIQRVVQSGQGGSILPARRQWRTRETAERHGLYLLLCRWPQVFLSGEKKQKAGLIFTPREIWIWVIDQVWGHDGWILAKFFFARLWTETKSSRP